LNIFKENEMLNSLEENVIMMQKDFDLDKEKN
jgi:hypothetical protein